MGRKGSPCTLHSTLFQKDYRESQKNACSATITSTWSPTKLDRAWGGGGGSRAFQRCWLLHIAINKARTRQVRVRGILILACGAFAVAFESLKLCYTLVWNAAVCPIENMPTHKHSFQSMPEDQGTYCSTHRPTIYDICMLAYP